MIEPYENLPRFQRLMHLCRERNIVLDPKPGTAVYYHGQKHIVLQFRKHEAFLVDELMPVPPGEDDIVRVEAWQNNPEFILCPGLEDLLQIVFSQTSLYPTLVPGIEETREVWKVQHPNCDQPYIFCTPQEALTELAISLLENPA